MLSRHRKDKRTHSPGGNGAASAGDLYEQSLDSKTRKAGGVYYTPEPIVEHVIRHTLGPLLAGKTPQQAAAIRVLDPACGCGAFLLGAYRFLLDWHRERQEVTVALRQRILRNCIFGVDLDPEAVALARQALLEAACGSATSMEDNIECGDALLGARGVSKGAPSPLLALRTHGFDAVVGNPPWGQKEIQVDDKRKALLWQRYPSSVGIFDLFRPFVELGIRLTAPGGRFGMVLPDIILLKDYPQTRRYLLDNLVLERIDCWGMAFCSAVIDTVSIIGCKQAAPSGQQVIATIEMKDERRTHAIPQADFLANPRHIFNLHLTSERRRLIDGLADCPRLGDFFEVHEGVHSGNIRAELFVDRIVDDTCRELLFGRDEIAPYRLQWQGRYIRLGALPVKKTPERYANLGRADWHERPKLLVRRTGDRVLAAVDGVGRFASNNFFVVFPGSCREPSGTGHLDLDGLCALLNSRFMTWYFRTIEPRRGKAFAELKIKHLSTFPLPRQVLTAAGAKALNELGRRRGENAQLDAALDRLVWKLYGVAEQD